MVKRKRNGISEFGGNMLRDEMSQHRIFFFLGGWGFLHPNTQKFETGVEKLRVWGSELLKLKPRD